MHCYNNIGACCIEAIMKNALKPVKKSRTKGLSKANWPIRRVHVPLLSFFSFFVMALLFGGVISIAKRESWDLPDRMVKFFL